MANGNFTARLGSSENPGLLPLEERLDRSLDIPTAIVAGVTLQHDAFYYHAWNEVCLNGQWISVDTTVNQIPADLYHIRFTRGDLEAQLAIGALIGKLRIEILPVPE